MKLQYKCNKGSYCDGVVALRIQRQKDRCGCLGVRKGHWEVRDGSVSVIQREIDIAVHSGLHSRWCATFMLETINKAGSSSQESCSEAGRGAEA